MSYHNNSDSAQLALLRIRFSIARPGTHATALRLGQFARERRIKITDYGTHSRRWIAHFQKRLKQG